MKPVSAMPSRSASISTASATNSRPITAARRGVIPLPRRSAHGSARKACRPSSVRLKADPRPRQGQPAHRLQDGLALGPLALQEVEARRHLVEEVADLDPGAGRARHGPHRGDLAALDLEAPGAGRHRASRLTSRIRLTAAIEGRASPRKPMVVIRISASSASFEVACRSTRQRQLVASPMPQPSSSTRISPRPPASTATAIRDAPASIAFSTSSFTTDAGRSTTSPAAMRLTRCSGRRRIGHGGPSRCGGAGDYLPSHPLRTPRPGRSRPGRAAVSPRACRLRPAAAGGTAGAAARDIVQRDRLDQRVAALEIVAAQADIEHRRPASWRPGRCWSGAAGTSR